MTNSFSIADYLENLNPLTCPLLSCQTYHVEDDSETNPAEISVRNNLDIVINTNIELDRNVILKCQNKAQNAVSQQFQVKVTCQTQQIDLPDGFQDQQVPVPECTTDAVQKAKFVFSQFKTQFSGCPMKEYKVYLSQTVQNVPYGLDVTNPISVGNQSTFEIPVANWENPSLFTFVIQGCDFQANCLFTSELTLQVKCPNPVAFNLVPSQYLTAMSTFVGAEGSQARYTFSASVSTLPRCNEIQFYEIIDVSPPGAITYPSESCSTDPCLVIDLDVRTEGTISFKVKPVDSTGLLPASDMITVTVSKDAQSPEIINFNQGQDQDQQFEPHSNKMFSFSPFQCTTGCTITNYQVFESGTSQNSVSGLGQPTFNSVNGKMEISVDTSALKTFQFVVKAEVENIPTIFAITNQLSAAVQCGSEIISVSQSQVPLDPFERASSIFSYTGFRAIFQSSVSECGLTTFELFTTSSLVTPWSDSSISFDQAQNLVIDQSVPQKQSVFIKGSSSSGAYNVLEVQIIVCGKEEITSLPEDQIYLFGSKVQEIDFQQYFETSYSQTNSDLKCTQIKQYSIVECEPSDDTSKFTISGQKIKIETSIPFKQNLCVQAQTLGQKTATHIQEIEIDFCGLEEISLEGASEQISKVFALNKKIHEIDFKEEGFSFSSSLPNCPATRFRILNEDLSVYTGSILELDSYKIKVQTLSPLQEVYYLEASSDEGKTNTELKIDLTICGFENITALQNDKTEVKLPASLVLHTLSNDIRKLFMHIGNSLCPIISYTIMQKNITEVVKFDGNQLQIYPKKAEENEFKITIKAQSLGYKTADFIYKIILLEVDEATLNQINNNQNKTETLSEDTDYKSLMDASFQEQITKNLPYYVKFSAFDCQNNDVTDTDQIIVYKVTSKYIGKDEEEKEIYFETILHFGCDLPAFVNEARGFFDPNKPGELLRRVKCFVRGTALEEILVKRKKLGKLVPTFTYLVNLYDNQIKFQVQVGIETESICNSVPGIQQIMEHESDHKTLENYQMITEVGDKVVQNINNNLEFKNQQKDLEKAITYSKPKIRSVKVKQEDYILTFSINFSNQMNFQGQQTCDFFNVTIISPYKSTTMQGFCSNNIPDFSRMMNLFKQVLLKAMKNQYLSCQ